MNCKMLSEEHRIVVVPMPKREHKGGVCICYVPSLNVIVINADCQNLEKIAEIIEFYLTIEGRDRLDVANCTNNESIKGVFHVLDQVARIRRGLDKSRRV